MKGDLFIGIDPGLSGGIAIVNREGIIAVVTKMPATDRDLFELLREYANRRLPSRSMSRAVLERAASSPQMGVVSAFKFGLGYGALRMALTAAEISFDEATPMKWQRAMNCLDTRPKAARLGTKDKNITKRRAQQLFPQIKITHAIADALLLAEYCRRFFTAGSSTIQD